jgi:hypothetical protein
MANRAKPKIRPTPTTSGKVARPKRAAVGDERTGHGWLKHDNSPGDLTKVSRCGARTRRGTPCQGPAMANGRCRMHGGLSTGPRTPKGLERSRRARWKHGRYSVEARRERRQRKAECAAFNAEAEARFAAWAPRSLWAPAMKRKLRS